MVLVPRNRTRESSETGAKGAVWAAFGRKPFRLLGTDVQNELIWQGWRMSGAAKAGQRLSMCAWWPRGSVKHTYKA